MRTGVKKWHDMNNWHHDASNVYRLAKFLVKTERLQTVEEMLSFLAKPWKWQSEWFEMMRECALVNPVEVGN